MKPTLHELPDAGLLDVKLLRLFELIYSTRSVTRAADKLGQSQPTVSIWLGKLRRELGDPLFVRTPAGMQPTPRADALIRQAREILQMLRQLSAPQADFDPLAATRTFCICMTDASHITLLPQLLAHLRAVAPSVRLVAARIDAGTAQALQSGEADVAIGLVPWLEAGFYQQTLFPQDWVCLVNGKHPRIAKSLTLRMYREEGHVAVTAGTGAKLLEDTLTSHRIERRAMLELPGFLGLSGIIAASDLIATLPRQIGETLAKMADLRVLECPFSVPSFTVKQHWHARFHDDAGNRWLRSVVASLYMRRQRQPAGSQRK